MPTACSSKAWPTTRPCCPRPCGAFRGTASCRNSRPCRSACCSCASRNCASACSACRATSSSWWCCCRAASPRSNPWSMNRAFRCTARRPSTCSRSAWTASPSARCSTSSTSCPIARGRWTSRSTASRASPATARAAWPSRPSTRSTPASIPSRAATRPTTRCGASPACCRSASVSRARVRPTSAARSSSPWSTRPTRPMKKTCASCRSWPCAATATCPSCCRAPASAMPGPAPAPGAST